MTRTWPLLVGLMACGDPISNQVLYEDGLFLSALPSPERLAPPGEIRIARVGTSAILASAVSEAAGIESIGSVLGGAANALRDEVPDERTDSVRRWTTPISTSVKLSDDEPATIYLVRGDIVQPAGANFLDWTMEASVEGDDWIPIASGSHALDSDDVGNGLIDWELQDHADVIGTTEPVPNHLSIEYYDGTEKKPRTLDIDDENVDAGGEWKVVGENFLIWSGSLTLVDGEDPETGSAQVLHAAELGGRASGGILTVDGPVEFDICWDKNGNDRYVSGAGLPTVGTVGDCDVSFD